MGLIPTVLLARTENSIKDEFLTPHSSPVKPRMDEIKAAEI
jgi:hypothetical protein